MESNPFPGPFLHFLAQTKPFQLLLPSPHLPLPLLHPASRALPSPTWIFSSPDPHLSLFPLFPFPVMNFWALSITAACAICPFLISRPPLAAGGGHGSGTNTLFGVSYCHNNFISLIYAWNPINRPLEQSGLVICDPFIAQDFCLILRLEHTRKFWCCLVFFSGYSSRLLFKEARARAQGCSFSFETLLSQIKLISLLNIPINKVVMAFRYISSSCWAAGLELPDNK